jgi:hypothetical protein
MVSGNKNIEIPDLADLLDLTDDELTSVQIPAQATAKTKTVAETAEQAEIRELKASLAKAKADARETTVARVRPEAAVETAEQAEIRELKSALALAKSGTPDVLAPPTGDSIIIHFVADGFLAFGQTWYRGQELEIVSGSPQHQLTFDRLGNSWLDLDLDAQFERWSEEKFRPGLWRGKKWGDVSTLSDPDEIADMERAAAAESKRRRAAPAVSTIF